MVTVEKENCVICKIPFPTHLLNPLIGDDIEVSKACPVCALAYIRKTHGTPEWMYTNETNRLSYEEALEIVKNDTEGTQDTADTSSSSR